MLWRAELLSAGNLNETTPLLGSCPGLLGEIEMPLRSRFTVVMKYFVTSSGFSRLISTMLKSLVLTATTVKMLLSLSWSIMPSFSWSTSLKKTDQKLLPFTLSSNVKPLNKPVMLANSLASTISSPFKSKIQNKSFNSSASWGIPTLLITFMNSILFK